MDILKELHKVNAKRSLEAFGTQVQEWTLPEWGNAVAGEVGEACNIIKKIHRKDEMYALNPALAQKHLANELADVIIYIDLIAHRENIDLESAIREKFNEVSDRRNCSIKIKDPAFACMLPEIDFDECRKVKTDCSICKWGKEIR